jgi:hypothetical protein
MRAHFLGNMHALVQAVDQWDVTGLISVLASVQFLYRKLLLEVLIFDFFSVDYSSIAAHVVATEPSVSSCDAMHPASLLRVIPDLFKSHPKP